MATGRPCSAHRLACSRAACGSFVHLDPVRHDKSGAARRVLSWPSLTPVTGTAKAAAPCIPSVSTSPLDLGQRHHPDPSSCDWTAAAGSPCACLIWWRRILGVLCCKAVPLLRLYSHQNDGESHPFIGNCRMQNHCRYYRQLGSLSAL
jgi:hypothetical protein